MGAWGHGILDNDTAWDVEAYFKEYLEEGLSAKEAIDRVKELGLDSEFFYFAIASLQMQYGCLEEEIREIALIILEDEAILHGWKNPKARKKALDNFKKELLEYKNNYNELWAVIKKTQNGIGYTLAGEIYCKLEEVLKDLTDEELKVINDQWSDAEFELLNSKEYNMINRKVVKCGDDVFYIDYPRWIIIQGQELFEDYMKNGYKAIISYVEKYNIPRSEYSYVCMSYYEDFGEDFEEDNL